MISVRHAGRIRLLAVAIGIGSVIGGPAWLASADAGDTAVAAGNPSTAPAPKATSSRSAAKRSAVPSAPAAARSSSAGVDRSPGASRGGRVTAARVSSEVRSVAPAARASRAAAGSGGVPTPAPLVLTAAAGTRRDASLKGTGVSSAALTTAASNQSPNLLTNPGAETGDTSTGYSVVTIPGWSLSGTPTVIAYNTRRRFPSATSDPGPVFPRLLGFPRSSSAPADSGNQFFSGGALATTKISQVVDLGAAADAIDQGGVSYNLAGDLGGFLLDPSRAMVSVRFLGEDGTTLGTGQLQSVAAFQRAFQTKFLHRTTTGSIPVGTRSAQVVIRFKDMNPMIGNYNNSYADNLSFTIGADLPAAADPTPPVSNVGPLDHVFVTYMENYGYTNIVGNSNAPYINSLIKTYGVANNYYAAGHPSNPNYWPVIGASDFGLNWNCPENCFDKTNLADSLEAKDMSWGGYSTDGSGYKMHDRGLLPFLAFRDIYDNPDRVAAHMFNISKLAGDLASPGTFPAFAWVAPDENTNMEGPFFGGTLLDQAKASLSHILPRWLGGQQYNIPAGDKWASQTLPSIFSSALWQDPNEKSAIFFTWDEDYNNLPLGVGNQGNHIVMIVIPSPGAIAAGMKAGPVIATDHYNHYSLTRTIEDALGLDPLTNNDKYAVPLNEFWN